ncbi:unnamed protein product [Rotaria magnacalcarata]|uniref:ZMYM2-like/QRICH1 C-terminal domain-containing protein n=1 Tax=Rotaria magnacalcarata TaxID=392030 RepID=A0A816ZK00_9BILA|nr:unnamed protein product [Rotaria magnacalcarata]CAF1645846.1 unnamed protein product [Rotaria magnacalcarata]CAF2033078.1 unnamed protein product [Rotaria magnacalcarata]CAF2145846.1 unnamed protein product [Rotaria magnacalcarata]CAF2210170.1 unnamed protein product [Rotaria magnacalcarata]
MATSLADFHQMIKLFGADTDEMNVTTTHDEHEEQHEQEREHEQEEEDDDDNETELQLDEESSLISSGEDETTKDNQQLSSTKPISSAAVAARLSRLANQRMDSNRFLICSGTNSYNTIRKTKHEVRRFALYLEDTFNEKCPIDELKPEQLCTYLKHYFGNVRKADNTEYEPDTLRSFMLSIERYLKSRKYSYNILESPVFAPCREVIQEKRDTWAKPTKNISNSKVEAFTSEHELLLRQMNIITRETPDGLLLELLINNSKYFDQRGNESTINRSLLWGDLQIKTDPTTSNEYVEYKRSTTSTRAYANPLQPNQCPIASLRLLTYHRPTQCSNSDSPFYLVPRTTTDQRVWYKTIRAGRHRLDLLIQQAMLKAGIQGKFSCMSLRKGKIKGLLVPSTNSELLDLSSNNTKKLKREQILSTSSSVIIKPIDTILPLQPQSENHHDDLPSPISITINNKRKLTSNDTFHALYAAAHLKSSRQSKINLLRKYLEETLGLVEFLTLYEYLSRNSYIKLQGTPIEHYEHILPVLLTLLMLENTA